MILTRDQILQADDLKTETVSVPEWGGEIMIRPMTLFELNAWRQSFMVKKTTIVKGKPESDWVLDDTKAQMQAVKLLTTVIVGEDGQQLFTEADIEALSKKSATAMAAVNLVARRLSGLDGEVIKDAEKNSEPGPSADSSSD